MMQIKWNITRKINHAINADILAISIGKSGRTWLRVLLEEYFKESNDTQKENFISGKVYPNIYFTHELWEHTSKANFFHRICGKYIIPEKIINEKKIVLLYRDPRDVVVSLYHHKTKRSIKK